jgi:competence protein ComGC
MAGFDSQTFPQPVMRKNRAFTLLTRLIGTLFVSIQILASFPLAHHHHEDEKVRKCECEHAEQHIHDSHWHIDHEDCPACLLLNYVAIVNVPEHIVVLLPADYLAILYADTAHDHSKSESARAPPVC